MSNIVKLEFAKADVNLIVDAIIEKKRFYQVKLQGTHSESMRKLYQDRLDSLQSVKVKIATQMFK